MQDRRGNRSGANILEGEAKDGDDLRALSDAMKPKVSTSSQPTKASSRRSWGYAE